MLDDMPQEPAAELQAPQGAEELGPPVFEDEKPIGMVIKPPQRRKTLIKEEDKAKVVTSLLKRFNDDIQDRTEWAANRIQRVAKYRGWREIKTYPWDNASNAHLPIIMTDVQRTEDTLHNAVLSTRPVMNAKATDRPIQR